MKRFVTPALRFLGSLSLAVVLLALVLLALGTGTVIESLRGPDVAMRSVYGAWWLVALEIATVLSGVAAIVVLWPWGRRRIGFLMTHAALLVILVGGLISAWTSAEGQLSLWEGESGNEIVETDQQGNAFRRATLPFVVRLDRFRIDHYPGTHQPSGFRSEVQLHLANGRSFSAAIFMNHGLTVDEWQLSQSSYNQEDGRTGTVLLARRDRGRPVVFAGYALLVWGLLVVLGTRVASARSQTKDHVERPERSAAGWHRALALATSLVTLAATVCCMVDRRSDSVAEALRVLPVQHDGRLMPLDTLAREAVWRVTGAHASGGADAVAAVVSWSFDANAKQAAILPVGDDAIASALALPPGTRHVSLAYLEEHHDALDALLRRAVEQEQKRPAWAGAAEKLDNRSAWMRQFVDRQAIRCNPSSQGDAWTASVNASPAQWLSLLRGERPTGWPSDSAMRHEVLYNQVNPGRASWILLGGALLLSTLGCFRTSRLVNALAAGTLIAGFGMMTWGIVLRWTVAGRVPASNMYESLLFLAWGVGFFAICTLPLLRNRLVVANASALAALTMILVDVLPIDRFIHPIAPILSGTPWLILHVPVTMLGYAVLAMSLVAAHIQIAAETLGRGPEVCRRLSALVYWYMHVGQLLLVVGIVTGSMWAASSWGRTWGWDPKEVWSLVAYLAYVAILHGRLGALLGPFGVASVGIIAFQAILMTYLGVNFVLATGLHSYGMGESPVARWMVVIVAAEVVFLVGAWLKRKRLPSARSVAQAHGAAPSAVGRIAT